MKPRFYAQQRWGKRRAVSTGSLTRTPQLLALPLVGEAHAVVAVGLATLTGGAVHLVEVGGTVGRLARAELREVALPCLLAAQCARGLQLSRAKEENINLLSPPSLPGRAREHRLCGTEFPLPIFHVTSLVQTIINLLI